MTFAQKYPTLHKLWSKLVTDETLLVILLWVGILRDKELLVGFAALGLLIIKYGNKREGLL